MQNAYQTRNQVFEFQVEGNIVYLAEIRRPSGPKLIKHSRRFIIARKGPQWKIRTTNLEEDAVEYVEMGCNGTLVFELRQMNVARLRQELGELPPNALTAQGWIRHSKFPVGENSDFIFPLWLAFCSSDYFISRKEGHLVSPELAEDNNNSRLVKSAQWQLNGSFLPSKVAWYKTGADNGFPPPFDGKFMSDSFEVASWKEFSGLHLPSRFEVKQFLPNHLLANPDPTQGELYLLSVAKVHAKSIQPLSDFFCLPELTRKTLIIDGRFLCDSSCDGLLSYGSSSWLTEADVEAKNRQHGVKYEKPIPQD
jgi:hypothetical protein